MKEYRKSQYRSQRREVCAWGMMERDHHGLEVAPMASMRNRRPCPDFQVGKQRQKTKGWGGERMSSKPSGYRFWFGGRGSQGRIVGGQLEESVSEPTFTPPPRACSLRETMSWNCRERGHSGDTGQALRNLSMLYVFPGNSSLAPPNLLRYVSLFLVQKHQSHRLHCDGPTLPRQARLPSISTAFCLLMEKGHRS